MLVNPMGAAAARDLACLAKLAMQRASSLLSCCSTCMHVDVHSQGLDAAGKTTILWKLKMGEIKTTIPTIGPS